MRKLAITLMLSMTASAAYAQMVAGGVISGAQNPNADSSLEAATNVTQAQVPSAAPYGDQGLTINNWSFGGAVSNPSFQNVDTFRVVGVNPGGSPRQFNGISSYVLSNASNCDGCADGQTALIHGVGVANGYGTALWGGNENMSDSINIAGYNGPSRFIIGYEPDINVGGAQTVATWLSVSGVLLKSPKYGAALTANFIGPGKITEFAYAWDGCCDVGLHLGLFGKPQGPNDGSQPIQMDWTDSVGNKNSLTLTAFNDTMVLQTTDKAAPAAYAVDGAAGIYKTVQVSASCRLIVSGGLITGTQGGC